MEKRPAQRPPSADSQGRVSSPWRLPTETLRSSGDRAGSFVFQSIIENITDGVVVTDKEGKFVLWNRAAGRLLGAELRKTTIQKWGRKSSVYLPDGVTPFPASQLPLIRTLHGEAFDDIEMRVHRPRKPDGVWLSVTSRPLKDSQGTLTGGVVVLRDLTEVKRRERPSAAQHAVTRVLAECNSLDEAVPKILKGVCTSLGWEVGLLWIVDPIEHVLRCTDIWHSPVLSLPEFVDICRHRTFSAGMGLPGRVWASRQPLWVSDVRSDSDFPVANVAVRSGLHSAFGFPVLLAGEALAVVEFFSREILEPDQGLLKTTMAIGSQMGQFLERKNAERELRKSREELQAILDNTTAVIYVKDKEGHYLFINKQYERVFHVVRASIIGKTTHDRFPKEVADVLRANDQKVLETGVAMELEEVVPQDDGSHVYISVKFPLRDAAGAIYAICGISTDITERQRAQKGILEKTAELARSTAEREQLELLAFVISHDLREPLQKIITFGEQLKDHSAGRMDHEGKEFLDRILKGAKGMNLLVDDVVNFAKVSLRDQWMTPVDLKSVVLEALSDLELQIVELKAHVELGELPTVKADRSQMRMLFANLIGNALKFKRQEAAPRVAVRARALVDGFVEIVVEDNGIGFNKEFLERIFKPFESMEGSREFPGSGVGLAICRKIVDRHGGKITAQSVPGQGSTFIVTLPRSS